MGDAQIEIARSVLPAELGKKLAHVGRRLRAPPVLAKCARARKIIELAVRAAVLRLHRAPAERSAVERSRRSRILRAALGPDRQRAAERVQTEQGVRTGNEVDRRDRGARDQIPVHRVAERLVDAHAVLVHRDPLRRAEQRRSAEPAISDVGLKGVALVFVDVYAGEPPAHEFRQIERVLPRDLFSGDRLDVCGNLGGGDAEAGQGRDADHFDDGRFELLRAVLGAGGASSERGTGQGQDQRNAGEVPLWHRPPP